MLRDRRRPCRTCGAVERRARDTVAEIPEHVPEAAARSGRRVGEVHGLADGPPGRDEVKAAVGLGPGEPREVS